MIDNKTVRGAYPNVELQSPTLFYPLSVCAAVTLEGKIGVYSDPIESDVAGSSLFGTTLRNNPVPSMMQVHNNNDNNKKRVKIQKLL